MTIKKRFLLAAAGLGFVFGAAGATEPGTTPISPSRVVEVVEPTPLALPVEDDTYESPHSLFGSGERFPSRYRGFMFGSGVYVMKAHFDNNLAYGIQGTSGKSTGPIPPGSPGVRTATRVEIDHQLTASPEFWLGYMTDSGWGVRARYWYFREGTNQTIDGSAPGVNSTVLFSAAPLGVGLSTGLSTLAATSKLEMQVWDAEGQYDFCVASWNVLLTGGVRFAQISQTYNAYSPQKGFTSLFSNNDFRGAGPTFAALLRHPLGSTFLNMYGSARYSLVFGDGHQTVFVPDQNVAAQDERHVGIGVGEIELGFEANYWLGRTRLFGQVGGVAQNWSGAGSASRSSVNVTPGGAFSGAAYTGDSDINFLGLAVRLGVNY